MCLRKKNLPSAAAFLACALCMFSSTFESGMYRLRSKARMTRETSTTKTVKAAFSKSVSCTSIDRNSTRQPTCGAPGLRFGGGFHRTVCQLVDCRFSKWSVSCSSSSATRPSWITSGSRTNRCATCRASASSMPAFRSIASASSSTGASMSLYLRWQPSQLARYREIESYRDLGSRTAPPPARSSRCAAERVAWSAAGSPRSSGVRSSTEPEMVAQRTSVSARRPLRTGVAAVSASRMGESTARWSYRWRDSSMLRA
mmetsp:Transcript_26383/g.61579  ORF Transcript_26383/g.61579 Transcript_26383/m.61579 type:complete len:257 (-) Transcript_26383:909-1679(-)